MREILARSETHDWVLGALSKERKGTLLDIPAGTGALAVRLRDIGFSVSCCDINPHIFSVQDIGFKKGDLSQSLPYPSESFDFITCIEGLEHVENPFNAVREFYRLLTPGGKLFVSLPNYLNIERRLRFLITGLFSKVPSPRRLGKERFDDLSMLHINNLTYPILKLILEHSGFKILHLDRNKKKKRMKWLLPVVWAIRFYCVFWSKEKREEYHLKETLSPQLMMGGNTLILVAQKKELEGARFKNDGRDTLE